MDGIGPALFFEPTQEDVFIHPDDHMPKLMVTITYIPRAADGAENGLLIFASTDSQHINHSELRELNYHQIFRQIYRYNNAWAISFGEVIMGAKLIHITLGPSLLHVWIEARRGTITLKFHRENNKGYELLAKITKKEREKAGKDGEDKGKEKEFGVGRLQGKFKQACFEGSRDPMFSYVERQGEGIMSGK